MTHSERASHYWFDVVSAGSGSMGVICPQLNESAASCCIVCDTCDLKFTAHIHYLL